MDIIIGDFNLTGFNIIDIEKVCKKWNRLWCIVQHKNKYRLVKYLRFDSETTVFKSQISEAQALELIDVLNLKNYPSEIFRLCSTWRREQDFFSLTKSIAGKKLRELQKVKNQ